jgi:hypothetical protein
MSALEWADANLRDASIWPEFNERLGMAFITTNQEQLTPSYGTLNGNQFVGGEVAPEIHNFVLTDVTRLHSSHLLHPLPVPSDALRVYDNGRAEMYHLRPQTPYQQ